MLLSICPVAVLVLFCFVLRHLVLYKFIYLVFIKYLLWERHCGYFKKCKTDMLPSPSLTVTLQWPFYSGPLLLTLTLLQSVIHIAARVIFLNDK